MPYNPSWNNPYLQAQQQFQQQPVAYQTPQPQAMPTMPQQAMQQAQPWGSLKVDGSQEAMNRFLMRYPASTLMPGFISEQLFDIDGCHFYTLSIEPDGRRNLERFKFMPDPENQGFRVDNAEFVSRAEFDDFTAKVNAAIGALNGLYGSVQPAAATAPAPAAATGALRADAAPDGAGAADVPRSAAGDQR